MEEMAASDAANPPPVPLPDLVLSLEQATQLENQLPSTFDPNHIQQIYSALHLATTIPLPSSNLRRGRTPSPLPPEPQTTTAASRCKLGMTTRRRKTIQ
ncbi:hypothetical protein LINGRAHAP2_LOCUS29216 [Linum grandiflorum]